MLSKEFDFHAPEDVETALGLLGGRGEREGARRRHEPVPAMNLGLMRPDAIVSLNHVPGLDYDRRRRRPPSGSARWSRHERLASDPLIRAAVPPARRRAASLIGDVQIRHRGTIGGSLSHADPAADYLPVL